MSKIITCLALCLSTTPLLAQDLPEPLARFQFDGEAKDSTGNKGNKLLMKGSPTFRDNALFHDGVYGKWEKWDEPESPFFYTPDLDFKAFTVAMRFKVESFEKNNILAGGPRYRWLSFRSNIYGTNPTKNLTVTFNNQDLEFEFPVQLEVGMWYSLVCGVDLRSRTVTTYLNGDRLPQINLPRDFMLMVLGAEDIQRTKYWCLANRSNGEAFDGLVDELAVFDGDVASKVAEDYFVAPLWLEILRLRRGDARPGLLLDEVGTEIDSLRQGIGQIERLVGNSFSAFSLPER